MRTIPGAQNDMAVVLGVKGDMTVQNIDELEIEIVAVPPCSLLDLSRGLNVPRA